METVVILITLLVAASFAIKLSFQSLAGMVVISAVAALFVWLSADVAVNQSKTQIADWLANPDLMRDTSVLLTVDVALQIAFCILYAGRIAGERQPKIAALATRVLLWFPGILIFPVLFAMLVAVIFAMPGADFSTTALLCAAGVLVVAPLAAMGTRWLLPAEGMRLELLFPVNILIAMLGIVATVNGRTAVAGVSDVDLRALEGVAAVLLAGAAAGFLLFIRRQHKQINH